MLDRVPLGTLMLGQHLTRTIYYVSRQPSQLGDFNAVALIGRTFLHPAQKNNPAAALLHRDVIVLYPAQPVGQFRQLVIMRGEQRLSAGVGVDIFDRDRKSTRLNS